MDEKLTQTLNKVVLLTQQNEEFGRELQKRLGINSSANPVSKDTSVKDDVTAIREALEIRANKSITYDFISDKYRRLKDQLIIDNLRMENAALNLTDPEADRFYQFCVNAFYQLENVVNYYFYVLYPDVNDLLTCIEQYTRNETKKEFQFHRNNSEKTVGDIAIASKLNALCNILFKGDNIKMSCSQLRKVRNEGAHRCMIIFNSQDENESLYRFYKYNTFNTIRAILIRLVNAVSTAIEGGNNTKEIEAEIISILPSACFIKCNGQTYQLPAIWLKQIKGKQIGDMIYLIIQSGKIQSIKTSKKQ